MTNIGGFLKHLCYNESKKEYFHKCAYSNTTYNVTGTESNTLFSVSIVCENDPYIYQACGFRIEIKIHSAYFCGGYFRNDTMLEVQQFVECNQNCRRNSGEESSQSFINGNNEDQCDDKCDSYYCKDESVCKGHTYGVYCASNNYVPLSFFLVFLLFLIPCRRYDKICVSLLMTMSLVLFDREAAVNCAMSCFERIIVVGISLTFEVSATSSSNSNNRKKNKGKAV